MKKRKQYKFQMRSGECIPIYTCIRTALHIPPIMKRRKVKKGRSITTYRNKLNKLEKRYKRFSKRGKFKTKYPTLKDFIEIHNIKEASKSKD